MKNKANKAFRQYIKKIVRQIYNNLFIYIQGIQIDNHSEDLIFLAQKPKDSINHLSFYLKNENRNNLTSSQCKFR